MMQVNDFREVHAIYADLVNRSLEIGFKEEHMHRLNDLYELRNDSLRRDKLQEITGLILKINDPGELREYWNSTKWYLFNNRQFLGKEFESMVAKKFDQAALNFLKQKSDNQS